METVNHPEHYNKHPSGVECIDIAEHFDFNIGSAIKYIWRAGLKTADAIQDLKKAEWYIKREIELLSIPYPNRTNVEFGTFSDDSIPEDVDDEAWEDLLQDDEEWDAEPEEKKSNRLDEKVSEVELATKNQTLIGFVMRSKIEADIRAQEDQKVFDLCKPRRVDKKRKLMKPKVKPSKRSTRKV